jgi:hypothetical protein
MKISNRNLGIIIVVAIIIAVGVAFLIHNNTSPKHTAVNSINTTTNLQPTEIPSPAESASPSASPTQYPSAYRKQVRTDFINDCSKVIGQNRTSECTCAADYLAAHYTDTELISLYLKYHLSGKIPVEVKTALGSCSPK